MVRPHGEGTVAHGAWRVHERDMFKFLPLLLAFAPAVAAAQAVQPGAWDVTSKVVDLTVPGIPAFMARMAKGKSKAEHRRLAAGEGIEALLAPDPKAHCRVDSQRVADGRYTQALSCPRKNGESMRIARAGTYTAAGFIGRATLSGATSKGAMSVTLDQHAVRVGD